MDLISYIGHIVDRSLQVNIDAVKLAAYDSAGNTNGKRHDKIRNANQGLAHRCIRVNGGLELPGLVTEPGANDFSDIACEIAVLPYQRPENSRAVD